MGRVCGFQTERAVVKLPARRSRYNDITRHASAAAFDPLTPISLSVRRGGEGVPSLGQPAWGGGHPYLPTQNVAHPPYPTTQKSQTLGSLTNGIGQTVLVELRSLTNGKGEAVEREREAVELAKSHKRKWSNSSFTNGIVGLHNNNDNVVASDAGRTRTSDPWDTRADPQPRAKRST
jgi:hypothetical protein